MREALFLALSLTTRAAARTTSSSSATAPTRGSAELTELRQQLGHQLRHIQVDGGDTNVGITRFAFRQAPDAEVAIYEVLLTVKNFSPQPVARRRCASACRRKKHWSAKLDLQPGQEEVIVSTVAGPLEGVAEAELALDDDLALDNRAYGVAPPPRRRPGSCWSASRITSWRRCSPPSPACSSTSCRRSRRTSCRACWRPTV